MSLSAQVFSSAVAFAEPAVTRESLVTVVPIALVGRGNVGRALLRQIVTEHGALLRRGVDVRVTAVVGRSGVTADSNGITPEALLAIADGQGSEAAERGEPIGWEAVTAAVAESSSQGQIVIDATAEDNADVHVGWLSRGWHVVTANKKPLTSSMAHYDALVGSPHHASAQYRYETAVGAGLPLLAPLRDMLTTGDEVLEIRAAVSGTLGFLCSACEDGMPFADAVAEAKRLGFTEPDPRQDLSGADVCRKALILGRLIGLREQMDDIASESLVPAELESCSREEFLEKLPAHSAAVDARFREVAARGNKLRYLLSVTPQGIRVGFAEVNADGPFGTLKGPENIFVIRTKRYDANPLVIRGPGAGAEVTAAGIFSDVLRIIRL